MDSPIKEKIILVNKPCGITSFDVIRIMQKILKIKKIGHAGTLDPNATGLMILGLDDGTKELSKLILNDKVYEAEILLGIETDTGDIEGKIIGENNDFNIEKDEVESICKNLVGKKTYQVPNYSAIKINGKKLYELARTGKDIDPVFRDMDVYSVDKIIYEKPFIRFTVHVSKGTYIRSLVKKICDELRVPGTLNNLKRTKIGNFDLSNAIDLPEKEIENFRNKKRL